VTPTSRSRAPLRVSVGMTLRLLPAHERPVDTGAELAPPPADEEVVAQRRGAGQLLARPSPARTPGGQATEAADVGQVLEGCTGDLLDGRGIWHRGSPVSARAERLGDARHLRCVLRDLPAGISRSRNRDAATRPATSQAADVEPEHVVGVPLDPELVLNLCRVDRIAAAVAGVAAAVAGPHLPWQDAR
jgi:hypothetical protein